MTELDTSERYFEPYMLAESHPAEVEPSPFAELPGEAMASSWLERASDLLAEDDPGPTPWLVDELIVDQAIVAVAGRWKTTKTYALLDAAISVVTGEPFLGRLAVTEPGPVILVLEESGRKALWRRLDSLCRGRAIDRDRLAELHYAANQRVKLDDLEWQNALLAAGQALKPRLVILDPLARLKAPGLDENAQKEYAVLVEFIRRLRDESGAAVAFVQHTGHSGEHMRGTSDLESVWETRLAFRRDHSTVTITSEHREAEAGPVISYQLAWDEMTRTIRLDELSDSVPTKVSRYLAEHPSASANDVFKALGGSRPHVLAEVKRQREIGGTDAEYHPGTTDLGTPAKVVPPTPLYEGSGTTARSAGTEERNHPAPMLGDDGFDDYLLAAVEAGHVTDAEALEHHGASEFVRVIKAARKAGVRVRVGRRATTTESGWLAPRRTS